MAGPRPKGPLLVPTAEMLAYAEPPPDYEPRTREFGPRPPRRRRPWRVEGDTRITVSLTKEQAEAVTRLAEMEHVSKSVIVRRAIDDYFATL